MTHLSAILPEAATGIMPVLDEGLTRVVERMDRQMGSTMRPVHELVEHVEGYRGKMLRPSLVLLTGLACSGDAVSIGAGPTMSVTDADSAHVTIGAVVEMIHVATLVHDDVLDEAEVRRGSQTINALRGNEAAVILGDYLISKAFHLCSTLDSQRTALRIGEVTSIVCEGEMLQLLQRGDLALDERSYFEIIERKTASLIAVACELGALHAGASAEVVRAMHAFGLKLGVAFQIQDDLLDLVGDESVVGKSLGKDLEKEKLTLPLIHHLACLSGSARMDTERLIHRNSFHNGLRMGVRPRLEATSSIAYAKGVAGRLVLEARGLLDVLQPSPARTCLAAMADAVIARAM